MKKQRDVLVWIYKVEQDTAFSDILIYEVNK